MTDYWSKLKLNECWSEKERYNKILNLLLNDESPEGVISDDLLVEEEEELSTISILVTDEENNPINQANVVLGDYEGTTGTAGGCTIKDVPFGDYEVTATATGFVDKVINITVDSEDYDLEIILVELDGPDSGEGTTGGFTDGGEF